MFFAKTSKILLCKITVVAETSTMIKNSLYKKIPCHLSENNVLATILQREKEQYQYIQEIQGGSSKKNHKVDIVSQLDNAIRKDIFEVFSPGTYFWFFYCGNTR